MSDNPALSVPVLGRRSGIRRTLSLTHGVLATVAAVGAGTATAVLGPLLLALPVGLGMVWLSVRWPSSLLALLLYLGVFKAELTERGLPIDATAVTAALLVIACAYQWLTGRAARLPPSLVALLAGLGLWMGVSLLWTPDQEYGLQKAGFFLTLTSLAALAPFFLIRTVADLRVFLVSVAGLALLGAGMVMLGAGSVEGRFASGESGDTISSARLLCAGALVLLFYRVKSPAARAVLVLGAASLLLLALGTGTRGAAIPFLAAIVLTQLSQSQRRARAVLVAAVGVLGLTIALPALPLPALAVERLAGAFGDPLSALDEDTRRSFYNEAVRLIGDHPLLGVGVGGFASVSYRLSDAAIIYPHNLFLEIGSELGLIAAAIVLVALLHVLWRLFMAARSSGGAYGRLLVIVAGLLTFSLLAAQFSSDINGNRSLWGLLGLSWLLIRHPLVSGAPEHQRPNDRTLPDSHAQTRATRRSQTELSAGRREKRPAAVTS